MIECTNSIEIRRPLSTVAFYAANPDRAISWYENIKEVEWRTSRPLQEGSRVAFKAKFLGRTLAYVYEIVSYEPKKELIMRTADGPFPMKTIYRWKAKDDHTTLMTLTNEGNPTGIFGMMPGLLTKFMNRANQKDLRKLKHILEASMLSR